jgi:uncharacterized membrane protein
MDVFFAAWISVLLRWFHVIAGIAWIGASFYFIWLDNHLTEPPEWKKKQGIGGDLWAIHGGGFYEVAKYKVGPTAMPKELHWFKWEAYTTWITGMLLLTWVYYFGAQAYLIDPDVQELSTGMAVGLGLLYTAIGWLMYEGLCRTPLVEHKAFGAVLFVLGTGMAWLMTETFSGRGAYIHMGALIGTIMAANVFVKIIPGQKKMVAAVARGEQPDSKPGLEGKQRSVHNNYLTLPIIFIMISNHYPMTYQHSLNWLILMTLILITVVVRHYFNLAHRGVRKPLILVVASLAFVAVAGALSWPQASSDADREASSLLTDAQGMALIMSKCATCHSRDPSDAMFSTAPSGVVFSELDDVARWASRIHARTVVSKDMPFMNRTEMTDEQRQALGGWLTSRF